MLRLYFGCLLFLFFTAGCSSKTTAPFAANTPSTDPSSEIPARREFPVNASVQPCYNFYEYACSIPVSRFKLREDRSRHIFAFDDSAERILKSKIQFLGEMNKRAVSSPRAQQLKDNYLACMSDASRKEEEIAQVEKEVKLVGAITQRMRFASFIASKILSPDPSFVSTDYDANLSEPSQYDFILQPTLLSLPVKEYYEVKELLPDYEELLKTFFESIADSDPADKASRVLDFERRFAQTYPAKKDMHDRQGDKNRYTPRTVANRNYPNLRLSTYAFRSLPAHTQIRDLFPESLAFVNTALANEPLETLKSVYLYHALSPILMDAYPAYFEASLRFKNKHLGGPPKLPERAERCTQSVMNGFEKELDAELINTLFPGFPKDRFNQLADSVRKAIIRRLEKNTWLSEQGREGALRKMRAARMQLVSPNNDEEWDFLEVAQYNPATPLANARVRQQKAVEKMIRDFQKGRDWKRWEMGPLTVNAYYNPSDNKFIMLQGILQYPFFDVDAGDVANFGAVGVVIGHELGHGFDNNGSRYNEKGVLEPWMPEADLKEFEARSALLVEQFNGYVPASINDEYGKLTLGENIADTSGLQFSYEAAFPGGVGTQEDKKRFYLQYARAWCGTMRFKELERRWREDYHAQTEKRVNGPLMHQAGFYEAYGCSAKDPMYLPEPKRMDLW